MLMQRYAIRCVRERFIAGLEGNVTAILLSRDDAAIALGLGRRTLDYLIARGELRVRRIGKRVLISRVELERFANCEPPMTSCAASAHKEPLQQ